MKIILNNFLFVLGPQASRELNPIDMGWAAGKFGVIPRGTDPW